MYYKSAEDHVINTCSSCAKFTSEYKINAINFTT